MKNQCLDQRNEGKKGQIPQPMFLTRRYVISFITAGVLIALMVSVAQAQDFYRASWVDAWYWTAMDDYRWTPGEKIDETGSKVTLDQYNFAGSSGFVRAEAEAPDYGVHKVLARASASLDVACATGQAWTWSGDSLRFGRYNSESPSEGIVNICYHISGDIDISGTGIVNLQFISTMDSAWGYEEIVEINEDHTSNVTVSKQLCGIAHYTIGQDVEYYESLFVDASAHPGCERHVLILNGRAYTDFSKTVRMASITPSPGHYLEWTASGATYPPAVPPTLTLTKQGNGSGTVTSDLPGIDCGSDCTESYDTGTVVTLTANPDPGSVFAGWSVDGGCPVPGNYQLTITKDTKMTALFINTENFTNVTMVFPNGGETLYPDQECTAIWGGPPTVNSYKLFYSIDNGTTWKLLTTQPVNETSTTWTVPKVKKNMATFRTKVIGYQSTTRIGSDKSDKPSTVEVIKLEYPNGGEAIWAGQDVTISWSTHATKRPVDKVKLSYSLDNGLTWKVFSSQPLSGSNPGSHTVTLPTVTKTKSKCKVKVVLKDSSGIKVGTDVSDRVFTILKP